MTTAIQQEPLQRLAELCELSPDVRFGQLLDHLHLLCEDRHDWSLAIVDDELLLEVMEGHREELQQRAEALAAVR